MNDGDDVMTEMTSRERVKAAINHIEPDRVPLDIGGGCSTSIAVEGYEKLKQYLRVLGETHKLSEIFRISKLDESIMQRLGSDCYPIVTKSPLNWTPPPSEPGTLVDNWGIKWKQTYYAEGCYYWDVIQSPLEKARVEDLESYPWPDMDDPGYTAGLAQEARTLHERTQYAIVGDSGFQSHWEMGFLLRGYKQILMDLRRNPEFVSRLMSRILEINMAVTGRFLDAVGQHIDVIRTSDDLATQEGLVMSPAMYRTFLKPVHKKFFDSIKSKTNAKIFYHSCGNIAELIDDLAEIGVGIINPVQVAALGDTVKLKARFGEKVAFWGGIDTQEVLPRGSPEDVKAEVRRRIHDLAPRGGYVLAAVHNIQPDVPPQNIVAMARAARELGTYPLRV